MIFPSLCIGLLICFAVHPAIAARGTDNDPGTVRRAIEKVSSDRRYNYPEEGIEFDINSEDLLERLAEWEEKRRKEREERDKDRWKDRNYNEREWGGVAGGTDGGGSGAGLAGLNLSALIYILYGLAVCVLAFIIYRLVIYYYPRMHGGLNDDSGESGDIYENLDPGEQLSLAEQLLKQGRWAEALSAMMMSLLLALDARRIIRYHRSRTNREYLWPMKKHPILYAVADEFVHNFEEMKYGHRTPDRDGATYMFDLFKQAKAVIPEIEKEETPGAES